MVFIDTSVNYIGASALTGSLVVGVDLLTGRPA